VLVGLGVGAVAAVVFAVLGVTGVLSGDRDARAGAAAPTGGASEGSGEAKEGTSSSTEDESGGDASEEGGYCGAWARAGEALDGIEITPRDLPAMRDTIDPYVEAIGEARDLAPSDMEGDFAVVLDYWTVLMEAAENPMSARDLTEGDTIEEYTAAMINLYDRSSDLCP
jgi:hypothetical protein